MILFADDLCLLAPTRNALDRMIKTCAAYCKEFGLSFNASKSKIMVFSKDNIDHDNLSPIYLNGREFEYVDSITYLGTTLTRKRVLYSHLRTIWQSTIVPRTHCCGQQISQVRKYYFTYSTHAAFPSLHMHVP